MSRDVPLKEHLNARIDDLREHFKALREDDQLALQLALAERDKALTLAEANAKLVTDHLNQVRTEQNRDRGSFVTKDTFDARLTPVERWQSKAIGVGAVLALFAGGAGVVITRALGG